MLKVRDAVGMDLASSGLVVSSGLGGRRHDAQVDAALAVARSTLRVAVESGLTSAAEADGICLRYSRHLVEAKPGGSAPEFLVELCSELGGRFELQALAWHLADAMVPSIPFCAFAGRLRGVAMQWLGSQPECATLLTYLGGEPLGIDPESRSLMIGHRNPVAAVVLREMIGKLIRSLRGDAPIISAIALPTVDSGDSSPVLTA